jgi:Xaa-Pro aminopeptidase
MHNTTSKKIKNLICSAILLFAVGTTATAQHSSWNTSTELEERPLFTPHFDAAEFAERRSKVYDAIGTGAIALVQGAAMPMGFQAFRQNNEFFYLSGIVTPFAYLVLDGGTRTATVYLQHRDTSREYNEGKLLSVEDADLVMELSGIDAVSPIDSLLPTLARMNRILDYTEIYSHFSPYEDLGVTRYMANRTLTDRRTKDPLDNRLGRHTELLRNVRERAPDMEIKNLDPITDELRKIKSPAEIRVITHSTNLQAEAIMESMRSSYVGVKPVEFEALARYIYWKNGVDAEAYTALIHFGPDANMNHLYSRHRSARDGDMILMDYGPVYEYYTSDMARMWPVNGKFNAVQRELYTFYLAFYEALLYSFEIGRTGREVMEAAFAKFDPMYEGMTFSKELYKTAADKFLDDMRNRMQSPFIGLGHGVGLAVHDVGNYFVPVQPGMVFVVEPQFRVPEENIYIRLEDMIVVTESGVDVITDHVPRDIDGIEALMKIEGILQKYPAVVEIDN